MNPPKRRGCVSVIGYLAILFAASLVAAPSDGAQRDDPPSAPVMAGAGLHRGASHDAPGSLSLPVAAMPSAQPMSVRTGTPEPTGEVGTALYSASATWCAPTPDQCQNWGGDARLAAVNSFRYGDAPYWIRVWRGDLFSDALVVSFCRCRDTMHAVDLSVAAWNVLSPGRPAGSATDPGRLDVAVEVLDWPVGEGMPPHPDDERMRVEDGGPTLQPTSMEDVP